MEKDKIYKKLESDMLRYSDLIGVRLSPMSEELCSLDWILNLESKMINDDMLPYTNNLIYVRKSVSNMLDKAAKYLQIELPGFKLQVVYGYRALSIQKKLFNKFKNIYQSQYSGQELIEATHRMVAVPEVSGHPTGGAVDIQIVKNGKPINMGTKIWEFSNDSFTFSPFIDKEAKKNRMLLRNIMLKAGFAPFDGEWWHFSYGDREWAKYYDRPFAIYDQIDFRL